MSTLGVSKKNRLKEQSQQLEEKKARIDREIFLIEKKEELSNLIFNSLLDGQSAHLCRYSNWIEHDGVMYKVNFSINHASEDEFGSSITSDHKGRKGVRGRKRVQKKVPKRVAKVMCGLLIDQPSMKKREIVALIENVKGFEYETMYTDFKVNYLERDGKNKGAGTLFKVKS